MSKKGRDNPLFIDRKGEIHKNTEGSYFEIIEYIDNTHSTIKFLEQGYILRNVKYINITKGHIKNPYHRSIYGVGYFGVGKYKCKGEGKKAYLVWNSMLSRCYDNNFLIKQQTYRQATVDECWHNYQIFAKWFYENYKEGFHLDKDILQKGNKKYSPKNCEFIPREINNLFGNCKKQMSALPTGVSFKKANNKYVAQINKGKNKIYLGLYNTIEEAFQVYKTEKEAWIKEVAEIWKPFISTRIYQTLIDYKVEIID